MDKEFFRLDYETRSTIDVTKLGAYRHAEGAGAVTLMAAVSDGGGSPLVAVPRLVDPEQRFGDTGAHKLVERMTDSAAPIYAFNASFEHAWANHRDLHRRDFGLKNRIALDRWRCSAVMARRAGLAGQLEKLAKDLGVKNQKDKDGKRLIKLFSAPQDDGSFVHPYDAPEDFWLFVEYCRRDVEAEGDVAAMLSAFELEGEFLETFRFDLALNDRGFPVDLDGLKAAQEIVDFGTGTTKEEFRKITGYNITQRARFQEWINARGYPFGNLQGKTIDKALLRPEEWDAFPGENAVEALRLYQLVSYVAVKKIPTMMAMAGDGGRVRGCFMLHGAGPGRWTAQKVQPQNFKRPEFKDTGLALELVRAKDSELTQMLFGNPIRVVSSVMRHFIRMPDGQDLMGADFASVEARGVCFLAGEEDALREFREYDAYEKLSPAEKATRPEVFDTYKQMAARIFQIAARNVDAFGRQVGKQAVLGCGYQMAFKRFRDTCAKYGIHISEELAKAAVDVYRESRPNVKALWYACEDAAMSAIYDMTNRHTYPAGDHLSFDCRKFSGVRYLRLRLPSGRYVCHPSPRVVPNKEKTSPDGETYYKDTIEYYKKIKGQTWGMGETYGGSLTETATQGMCADLMAHGCKVAVANGHDVFSIIHDEALAPAASKSDPFRAEKLADFCRCLSTAPGWADGLPLVAEGAIQPYYTK